MSEINLTCRQVGHEGKPILGVCIEKDCKKPRPFCFQCSRLYHNQHDSRDFSDFEKFRQDTLQIKEQITLMISEIDQTIQELKELMHLFIIDRYNLTSLTIDQMSGLIDKVVKWNSIGLLMDVDLQQLKSNLSQVREKFKSFKPLQEIVQQQIIVQQLPQQIKQYHFSNQDKFTKIIVSDQGNIAKMSGMFEGFALCEESIQQNGTSKIGFKIIKCTGHVCVGVCQKTLIKQNQYLSDLKKIGHGAYLVSGKDGKSFSHHQAEKNHEFSSFEFTENDVVIVLQKQSSDSFYFQCFTLP